LLQEYLGKNAEMIAEEDNMRFLNIKIMTNLSVDKSVQDEEADEGDDCMDDEVEVDEIILHIEWIETERGCLNFKLGVIFMAIIDTGL
jgi:hypothetical protein